MVALVEFDCDLGDSSSARCCRTPRNRTAGSTLAPGSSGRRTFCALDAGLDLAEASRRCGPRSCRPRSHRRLRPGGPRTKRRRA
jgi:hypothetical protein